MKSQEIKHKETIEHLKGCYKKLKSQVYFSSTSSYVKMRIALFESNREEFEKTFDELGAAIENEDTNYFKNLFEEISIFVAPKSVIAKDKGSTEGTIDNMGGSSNPIVQSVNFYFDGPIQLFIFDMYVTLMLGIHVRDNQNINHFCYANLFHRETFDNNGYPNFNNLNTFKFYFSQYKKWKNDAIRESRKLYDSNLDSSIISLDLTGYFYFVDADIKTIINKSLIDLTFNKDSFFIDIIQEMFVAYTDKVKKFRLDITRKAILPIGLNTSYVLANLYLSDFDERVSRKVKHYGRYVDDIIIVIDNCDYNSFSDFVNDNQDLFSIKDSKSLAFCLNGYPDLIIKRDKCRIIRNFKDGSSDIFSKLYTEEYSISEYNLFPSFDTNIDHLLNGVYKQQEYIKFRDFDNITVDPSKISRATNGVITARKGTSAIENLNKRKKSKSVNNKFASNLLAILSCSDLIGIWNKWDRIVVLLGLLGSLNSTKKLKKELRESIEQLVFSPTEKSIYASQAKIKNELKEIIKRSLRLLFINAFLCYGSLIGKMDILKKYENLCQLYRRSNLFPNSLIKYPLVNFCSGLSDDVNLLEIPFEDYIKLSICGYDNFSTKYSPYYISLNDYLWAREITNLIVFGEYDLNFLFDSFYEEIGYKQGTIKEKITINTVSSQPPYYLANIDFSEVKNESENRIRKSDVRIAIASIDLDKMGITKTTKGKKYLNKKSPLNAKTKEWVIDLLNDSYIKDFSKNMENIKKANAENKQIKEDFVQDSSEHEKKPVNFIVFPESFLPFEWIHLIDKFSKETQTIITTGIRYVVYNNRAYNLVAVEIPYYDSNYHKQSFVVIRDKNALPMYERNILNDSGLFVYEKNTSTYFSITRDDVTFAPMICYEATDISARSLLKGNVDYIFTVAYNMDTTYFNSIGMSTSRDVFCFYIENNSSSFGSSSYAPYRNKFLPISSNKGDVKNHMQIISTDLQSLLDYKEDYFKKYASFEKCEYGSDDKKSKFKKPSANTKRN